MMKTSPFHEKRGPTVRKKVSTGNGQQWVGKNPQKDLLRPVFTHQQSSIAYDLRRPAISTWQGADCDFCHMDHPNRVSFHKKDREIFATWPTATLLAT